MRAVVAILTLGAAVAGVWTVPAEAQRLRIRVGAETPFSECYCRTAKSRVEVGQTACLAGPQGARQATCEMSQNVTNWRFSDNPCPES